MPRPLISPGMFNRLHEFYPSTVTIQVSTEAQDTFGEPQPTWANLPGHIDLSCRLAPSGGKEVKAPDQTYAITTHIIAIAGYYPTIIEKNQAIIGTQTFDILLVESDGQGESTRLSVEIVT